MFKTRNIIKRLTALLISIAIILTTLQLQPLIVYADGEYIGDEGGGGEGAGSMTKGVSVNRTGFLFYLTNENGYAMSQSILVTKQYVSLSAFPEGQFLYATKMGSASSSASYPMDVVDPKAPTPVVWTGSAFKANGRAVKDYLWTKGEKSGLYVYEYLIKTKLPDGEHLYQELKAHAGEWYVWVEPVAWSWVWNNGSLAGNGGQWFATASNWAQIYKELGQGEDGTGDKKIRGFTHKALPYSMVLDTPMTFTVNGITRNFGAHAGESMQVLKNKDIQEDGYGVHIIRTESNGIHTYNGVDSPGNPETNDPPRDGTCNIVKGYYTEERENGVVTGYINDGTFSTLMCTNIVGLPFQAGSPYFIQR